ncbi:type IV pilus assembly protein PilV [Pseudomonas peli]|uniref:Type IV pilus assembly protein PilV n=2 Tax=Pseudomonas peli TaxID=592361 RepID=A0AB37Z4Q1_9PSED|nr:type IV pilus assembly protein PilV [Pseudomonas peli]
MNRHRGMSGFSMIEVLVTLIIVTTGVLGMVAMQGRSIQFTQDSAQRGTAGNMANELLELMRANPEAFLDSRERYKETSDFYKAKGSDFPPCPTPALTAKDQLGCWAQRAGENLPGGSELLNSHFKICRSPSPGVCNAAAGSAIEISMAWRVKSGTCIDANDQTADKSICTFNLRAQL